MTDENYYLIDNNVLAKLNSVQRGSTFFLQRCRVPDAVIREAGVDRARELEAVRYPTTPEVLRELRKVTAAMKPGDTSLIDLYRNKGSADPFLIACALVEQRRAAELLFAPEWVIITDDRGVHAAADKAFVKWLPMTSFISSMGMFE